MTRHAHSEFFRLLQRTKPGRLARLCAPALDPTHPGWSGNWHTLSTLLTTGAVRNPLATQYH